MNISRELWLQIDPLLNIALEMDIEARAAWLKGLDTSEPQLAPLLRKMLATHERAERSGELETVPQLAPIPPPSSGFDAGARVGPFSLIRLLGRGGMGEVWLARQADGRVERTVALKLPTIYQHSEAVRERFRRERDILAKLAHPNIARLFDAGVSEEAGSKDQPYLAMEYVEGVTLTEFTSARQSTIEERLKLFRQILAAVAHAHRHLVVHRDLKPANILIDQSGEVKLLDFGIAKLIDDGEGSHAAVDITRLGGRVMTLRYAAPEQASGDAISTATDTYALGVILHELLTGLSPHRAIREGRAMNESSLVSEDTTVPSSLAMTADAAIERRQPSTRSLARRIAGDLDAIVLKAMRRNPADRYGSAEQFDDDILRHLEHLPVTAREGTWRYLAGRFAARHRLPLAAAAAILLTMLAGVGMVEQQRRVALAEKTRAEKHFASVRKLANAFMFDVHGEIENLSGALKARQILVATALKYLDSLAGEAGNDPELALEVAVAYRKLAEIKGDGRAAHLGEVSNARRNAESAATLLEAAESRQPDNLAVLREHRVLALLIGRLKLESGDASGVAETEKATRLAKKITLLPGATLDDRGNLGATLAEYGGILAVVKDDHAAAAVQLTRATEYLEGLVREHPADLAARARLAYAYERAAMAAEVSGNPERLPQAIALLERSIATTESLVRDEGLNLLHAQKLVTRNNNAARVKLRAGDAKGARANAATARKAAERQLAADPGNVSNSTMLAGVLAMASDIEYRSGHFADAIQLARESIAIDARLPAETRAGLIVRENLAGAKVSLGASNCALAAQAGQPTERRARLIAEAHRMLGESRAFKQELVDRKIDAREAAAAIAEIDAELKRCTSVASGKA